jgi:hypothetical protein
MLTLVVKAQWVCYMLDETTEQPCSDFLADTSEVCKGARQYNEYSAIQGLAVMSGMDPHMISGIWDEFWLSLWLGCVDHGETPWCDRDRYL